MIHETVRFGENEEEYPIRITYIIMWGKPSYSLIEQYTQVGPDQEDWEVYIDESDEELERWDDEILASLTPDS